MNATGEETGEPFNFFYGLCREPFWDVSSVWETESPQISVCVERTVLVWLPCVFLWLSGFIYLLFLRHKPYDQVPWTALIYSKLMLSILLVVVAVVEFVWAMILGPTLVPPADMLAPPVLMITHLLHVVIVLVGRHHGTRSSSVLSLYWFLVLVCGIPQLYTTITSVIHGERVLPGVLVVTFVVQYLSSLTLFVANCISDQPSKLQELYLTENSSPELNASPLNRLFFFYNLPMIWRGWRRPLTEADLWNVVPRDSATNVFKKWQSCAPRSRNLKAGSVQKKLLKGSMLTITSAPQDSRVKVMCQLWGMARVTIIINILIHTAEETFRFLAPSLLSLLIQFMSNASEPQWHGYLYAVGLFVTTQLSSCARNQYYKSTLTLSVRVRSALMTAVYNKALYLSASARRDSTVGQIVNLMAVDSQSVGNVFMQLCAFVMVPITISVAFVLIWQKLGPATVAGMLVLLLIIPINGYILRKAKRLQRDIMTLKDKRVKMISEIIAGIKVLKLYAWEASFTDKVKELRNEELKLLKQLGYIQAFNSFIFNCSPYMVALATFTTYLLSSSGNVLDAEKAFVSLSLFNIIRLPVIQMPDIINLIIEAHVAMKRIEKYLNADEIDPLAVTSDSSKSDAVVVQGGHFHWGSEEGEDEEGGDVWRLSDVDLTVPVGHLVAVVGTVGAGKSSLLAALLGEIKKDMGKVVVNGSIAYVSQQAWLQNATLRDNITWGEPYEPSRYKQVVAACALQPDIDMLPAGDMTHVGEKGINMSGGQKQRVSLARAVYSNAKVFLLDDPLSAVDSHVGKHIFEQVIGPQGMLKEKTRVLVTHAVTFLPQVDSVVVVSEGKLVEQGPYSTLLAAGGNFATFMLQHINTLDEDTIEEELDELRGHLQDTVTGGVILHQFNNRKELLRQLSRDYNSSEWSRNDSEGEPVNTPITRSLRGSCSTLEGTPVLQHRAPKYMRQSSVSSNVSARLRRSSVHLNGSNTSLNRVKSVQYDGSSLQLNIEELVETGNQLVKEETTETGRISKQVYLVYWRAMGMWYAIVSFVCVLLAQMCNAGSNVWLSIYSTNNSSSNSSSAASPDVFLAAYGAFGIGQVCLQLTGTVLVMLGGIRAASSLHTSILNSVIHFPMRFFDTNPSGRVMTRFSKEVDVIDRPLPGTARAFIIIFTQISTTMALIIGVTPISITFLVPIFVLYLFIQQVFVATSRQLKRLESVAKSPVYSHFSETLTGASIVRAFNKQDQFFKDSLQKIGNSLKSIYINITVNRWLGIHLETIGNVITFTIAAVGVAQRGNTDPGSVALTITYSLNVTMMLNWMVRVICDFEANVVSVERIDEYVHLEHEAPWEVEDQRPSASWPEKGCITFNNYQTRYQPDLDLVLKGISCTINPSEKVGIVGRTGAGKSSLTLALFRLIEASAGHITIDNIKIANIGLHHLRSTISIIPQDPVLFSGTLRMNLDPFGTHSDADVWRALELAHLNHFVHSHSTGLQYIVDEDGSNFSVGQRQLVCLARALLRDSRVLVLDEATAAVDLETDDLLQATIREQFSHCTVLTIAHRLNTIMDSDRVLVLDQGRIEEFDTPAALLQMPESIFYNMAKDAGIV